MLTAIILPIFFLGPPGPSFGPVPAAPEHAYVQMLSVEHLTVGVRVLVQVGPHPVDGLVASLYCQPKARPATHSVLADMQPWKDMLPTANRQNLYTLYRGNTKEPCTPVLSWRVNGLQYGMRAVPEVASTSKSLRAPLSAVDSTVNSLPYLVRCDPLVGCLPNAAYLIGLQVCYLGDQPLPRPSWAETHCPNDTRTGVTMQEWCSTLRNIGRGPGVTDAQAKIVRSAPCP